MSDGRLILGIGAAWSEREHRAYGWDFPAQAERSDRLEEACRLLHLLFESDAPVTFSGRYYRLEEAPFSPKSVQRPRPPILIGGGGERRTLRTVARYGDVMNVRGTPEQVAQKIRALEAHCRAEGRDPLSVRKSVVTPAVLHDDPAVAGRFIERHAHDRGLSFEEARSGLPIGDAAHIRGVLERYADAGVDLVIFTGLPNRPKLYERIEREVLVPLGG
jgi:alkanesulfonate monooxygenase SsuD/methylene tetrahydromethanopterin reductase-like flavin-dependent oxidoreductase (luciferase family)